MAPAGVVVWLVTLRLLGSVWYSISVPFRVSKSKHGLFGVSGSSGGSDHVCSGTPGA